MTEPRINDARAKRLRNQLRAHAAPCHLCGGAIDYDAHHHDPASFQVDHLWQVANGGPEHDPDNCASAHRACNRTRSDTIDHIAIAAAARYGVTLTPPNAAVTTTCAPNGQHCATCNGTHNPTPGVTFITARNWWADPHPDAPHPPPAAPTQGIGITLEASNVPG